MIGGLRKASLCALAGASALGILASGATSANAASVEQLEAQMKAMQAQMRAMQQQVNQAKADAAAAKGSNGENLDVKGPPNDPIDSLHVTSRPPLPQGWHLNSLIALFQAPFAAPYFCIAC